ncbi:PQQ-binding-like beta-propeller repeat protein [Streptomyces sp. NPDC006283]|uniref:outer membrane protein assembly factor BamB family protein n=1 Tax=Streptomyces sp. NPDC006283 TaxID=3156741 RepID=UPI0033B87197
MVTRKGTWRSWLGTEYDQPRPVVADDRHVYVFVGILEKDLSTPNNVVAALDTTSGKVVWREPRDAGTQKNGISAQVVGNRLVCTDFGKGVTVRDTATGKQVWTKRIDQFDDRRFAVHEGLMVVTTGSGCAGSRWPTARSAGGTTTVPGPSRGIRGRGPQARLSAMHARRPSVRLPAV